MSYSFGASTEASGACQWHIIFFFMNYFHGASYHSYNIPDYHSYNISDCVVSN